MLLMNGSTNIKNNNWIDFYLYDGIHNRNGIITKSPMKSKATSTLYSSDELQKNKASELDYKYAGGGKYGIYNLFDSDPSTVWVEGKEGNGIGETIFFILPDSATELKIINGYAKSKELFKKNNRPKKLKLSIYAGINPSAFVTEITALYKTLKFPKEFSINLKDVMTEQSFKLPISLEKLEQFKKETIEAYNQKYKDPISETEIIIKLEIEEVYEGSEWDDTCLSEISFNNVFIYNLIIEKLQSIDSIYISKNGNSILVNSYDDIGKILINDENAVFQLIDVSSDKQWAIIIRMSAEPHKGRKETEYLLLNTFMGEFVNEKIKTNCCKNLSDSFFFLSTKNSLFLEYMNAVSQEKKYLLLM